MKYRPGKFVIVAGKTQEGRAVNGAPLRYFDFLKFFPICSFQSVCEKRGGKGCHLNGDNAPPEKVSRKPEKCVRVCIRAENVRPIIVIFQNQKVIPAL